MIARSRGAEKGSHRSAQLPRWRTVNGRTLQLQRPGLCTGKTVGEKNIRFLLDRDNIAAETQDSSLLNRYVYGATLRPQ